MSSVGRRPVASQPSPGAAALRSSGISAARSAELRRKYPGAFPSEPLKPGETAASIAKECEALRREIAADRAALAKETGAPARRVSSEQARINGRAGVSAARSEELRERYSTAYAQGDRP